MYLMRDEVNGFHLYVIFLALIYYETNQFIKWNSHILIYEEFLFYYNINNIKTFTSIIHVTKNL